MANPATAEQDEKLAERMAKNYTYANRDLATWLLTCGYVLDYMKEPGIIPEDVTPATGCGSIIIYLSQPLNEEYLFELQSNIGRKFQDAEFHHLHELTASNFVLTAVIGHKHLEPYDNGAFNIVFKQG